MSKPLVPER